MDRNKLISILKSLNPGYSPKDNDIWKTIVYDSVPLAHPTTHLFREGEKDNFKAVTAFTEREILDFLFSKHNLHHLLLDELGLPKGNIKSIRELQDPIIQNTNEKPGDLDLVLFSLDSVHRAVVIEAKCVKARTLKSGIIVLNKEKNIAKGISQVNQYLKFGFHRTYLLMILLDDGQHNKRFNQWLRDTNLGVSRKLFNKNFLKSLHPDIGLIYLKVNQITGKSILQSGKISLLTAKIAKKKKQKKTTTNAISSLQLD